MSFTLSNRINNMDTGTNVNTWGSIIDGNFTLIDQALDGVLSLTVTNTVTLVYANDTTDQAHYAILSLTGTGGTIVLQAIPGQFLVANKATGPITFLISGGTANAVVKPGDTTFICNDGVSSVSQLKANGVALRDYIDGSFANAIAFTTATAFSAAAGSLPGQPGNAGNYLQTNGTTPTWVPIQFSAVVGGAAAISNVSTAFNSSLSTYQANVSASISSIVNGGTLTNPTLTGATISSGTIGALTGTGMILNTPTISSPSITGGTASNLSLTNPSLISPTISGSATLPFGPYILNAGTGGNQSYGGRINLQLPVAGSTLNGPYAVVEMFNNSFRVYEQGGSNRGVFLDLSTCAAGANTGFWTTSNFSPSAYQTALGYTPLNKAGDSLGGALLTFGTGGAATQFAVGEGALAGIYGDTINLAIRSLNNPSSAIFFQSYSGGGNYAVFSSVSATFTVPILQNGYQVWHAGNFNPASYQGALGYTPANLAGASFSGAVSVPTLNGYNIPAVGLGTLPTEPFLATVQTNGVMEIGSYIDMHAQGDTSDYTTRLQTPSSGVLTINGQTVWHTGNLNPAVYMQTTGGTFSGNIAAPIFFGNVSGNVTGTASNATNAGAAATGSAGFTISGYTGARVAAGTAANSGLISWGTGAPGTLAVGQIYFQVAAV